eukprot:TRINITY_DN7703_c0_g1_i1.p1 TRINITY_DN7703_c0_g1~~TRINITY_DN7703_c0_g1_i1.p1  ORF type:complete len:322 (+),score=40.38 TRINITY_DN7703_c0_g1_i1:22-987(+)
MRWRLGQLGRVFRRLWPLMMYSQLLSPLVAVLAVLTASALGIDTDASITQSPTEFSTDSLYLEDNSDTLTLIERQHNLDNDYSNTISNSNKEDFLNSVSSSGYSLAPPRKTGVLDSCCKQAPVRPCPLNRTPSKERCLRSDHSATPCSELSLDCVQCECDYNCTYGELSSANCTVIGEVMCAGSRKFVREFTCRYCYLSGPAATTCSTGHAAATCSSVAAPSQRAHWYVASCYAKHNLLCLGSARFSKKLECNWTEGYSWKTALALSITLGGFGADRFYLGYWQEGIGKLFSFGGLGVWTLVDVILVAVRYIGPADGSLYI